MREALESLVVEGLSYMKAGSLVGERATAEVIDDVSHPILKDELKAGQERAKGWANRIDLALDEVGGSDSGENLILQAHYEVSKKIRTKATDDFSRDLGIISAGQMALHYWIASFGTMQRYAEAVGYSDTAHLMEECLEEAKEADLRHSELAALLLNEQASEDIDRQSFESASH